MKNSSTYTRFAQILPCTCPNQSVLTPGCSCPNCGAWVDAPCEAETISPRYDQSYFELMDEQMERMERAA